MQALIGQILIHLDKKKKKCSEPLANSPQCFVSQFGAQQWSHQNMKITQIKTSIAPSQGILLYQHSCTLRCISVQKYRPHIDRKRRRQTSCGPVHPPWAWSKWVHLHYISRLLLCFSVVVFGVLHGDWSIWPCLIKLRIPSILLLKDY